LLALLPSLTSSAFQSSPNPYSDKGSNNNFEDDSDLDEVEDAVGQEDVNQEVTVTAPIVFTQGDAAAAAVTVTATAATAAATAAASTAAAPVAPFAEASLLDCSPASSADEACLLDSANSAFGCQGMTSTITPSYAANTPMGEMQELMRMINQQGSRLLALQSERKDMIATQEDQEAIVQQSFNALQREMAIQQSNLSSAMGVIQPIQPSPMVQVGGPAW
jgi:hypothetical protein